MTDPKAADIGENPAKEPVLSRTAVMVVVALLASLLIKLGIPVDDDTKNLLIGAVALVAPTLLGLWARLVAWSPDSVSKLIDDITRRVSTEERTRIENLNRAEASGSIPSYEAPTTNLPRHQSTENDTSGGLL